MSEPVAPENMGFAVKEITIAASSNMDKYPAKQHAERVARKLGVKEGLIYLRGQAQGLWEDSDQEVPFRQRRFFYYLSGVNEPGCHMTYDIADDFLTLFIPEIDKARVIWTGRGSTAAEAYDQYDVDNVQYSSIVNDWVRNWTSIKNATIYILHPDQGAFGQDAGLFDVDSSQLLHAISLCRVIKDPHEIKVMRKAQQITADAHRAVLKRLAKMSNEAEVEAVFLKTCAEQDAKNQAYGIIAGSGPNASTLHYTKNNDDFAKRQVMVLDAGCEWQLYASDVTRTFPLNGKWTKEAKEIYDVVELMQESCIKRIKPGLRFIELHVLAHRIAVEGLLKLGIFRDGSIEEIVDSGASRVFFPHGLGHHLGLEVHDVADVSITGGIFANDATLPACLAIDTVDSLFKPPVHIRSPALEEGMIVTVEPGLYFSSFALEQFLSVPSIAKFIDRKVLQRYVPVGGVRIEDDILVTETGYENMTTAPKGDEALSIINGEAKALARSADISRLLEEANRMSSSKRMSASNSRLVVRESSPGRRSPTSLETSETRPAFWDCHVRNIPCPGNSVSGDVPCLNRGVLPCFNCTMSTLTCRERSSSPMANERSKHLIGDARPIDNRTKSPCGCISCGSTKCSFSLRSDAGTLFFSRMESHKQPLPQLVSSPLTGVHDRSPAKDPLPPRPERGLFDAFANRTQQAPSSSLSSSILASKLNHRPREMTPERAELLAAARDSIDRGYSEALGVLDNMRSWPRSIADKSNTPNAPGKTPQLPSKPLAYRHSLSNLAETASEQRRSHVTFSDPAKTSTANTPSTGKLHYFESIPGTSRSSGLQRVQSMRLPQAQSPDSSWDTSEKMFCGPDITIRIAAVAATYVNSIPQNRSKNIDGDEIRRMLEQNPAVANLYWMLRALSVSADVETLSQALVKAVPNVNLEQLAKPLSETQQAQGQGVIRSHTTASRPYKGSLQSSMEPSSTRDTFLPYDIASWAKREQLRRPRSISGTHEWVERRLSQRMSDVPTQEAHLSGTHEWVERRASRLMNDEFLKR